MVQKATELQEKLSNVIDEKNIPFHYDTSKVVKDEESMVLILNVTHSPITYHTVIIDGEIYEVYKQLEYERSPDKTLNEPTVDEAIQFILR